eukprot:1834121-Rhodomonas_salina.2
MRWSADTLYVAAWMEEPNVWANITQEQKVRCLAACSRERGWRRADACCFCPGGAGSTHGYKQVDVNAAGTVWGIALTKSYLDGGSGPRPSCPRPAPPPDPCPRLASGGSAVGGLQCVV